MSALASLELLLDVKHLISGVIRTHFIMVIFANKLRIFEIEAHFNYRQPFENVEIQHQRLANVIYYVSVELFSLFREGGLLLAVVV